MGLSLLLGGSGYGKSWYMYDQVIQKSIRHPETNYFIIVPEQYTMQIQKTIVQRHPDHVTTNIDVVSFGRLAYRIFNESGIVMPAVLDDIGKNMVLRRVIGAKAGQLKVFGGNVQKTGFVSEVKSTISELLQYHVRPDQLGTAGAYLSDSPALRGKLSDLAVIYEGFLNYIDRRYITTEGILDRLTQVIGDSRCVAQSEFYLDEFTGFTPSQYDLLRELLLYSRGMQIALTVDPGEDYYKTGMPYQLFYLTRETIHKLNTLCARWHIEREEDIVLRQCRRFTSDHPIAALEKHIFRRSKSQKEDFRSSAEGDIVMRMMPTPIDELQYISGEILKLCHDGLRYRDIAIVTGDLSIYGHIAQRVMEEAGIPYFIDSTRDVLANNLVEFLRALLEILEQDFNYDSVFRFLKTGLTDIEMEDVCLLENYVLATGIRGFNMWSSPFKRTYKGMQAPELDLVNEIRERVMSWLTSFREEMRLKKTADNFARAMINFLNIHEIEAQMEQAADEFDASGELALAREYRQIYRVISDILERTGEILKDEEMTVRIFAQILDAGLSEAKVGIIPPGTDQVMIGDIRRTRLGDIKVLFFVGVNDGIVPAPVKDGGLITDRDKQLLMDDGLGKAALELAPTGQQDAYTERFYLYAMMTKPKLWLYISCSKRDSSGKGLRPSSLIERLNRLFPEISLVDTESKRDTQTKPEEETKKAAEPNRVEGTNQETEPNQAARTKQTADDRERLYGKTEVFKYLIDGLRGFRDEKVDKFWLDLYSWMRSQDDYAQDLEQLAAAAFFAHSDEKLSKASVRALYGTELSGSVTTLERYASCAYAHFLAYGMRLQERPKYQIAAPDLGVLFHGALELFSRRLSDSAYNWHTVPDGLRDELASQCVQDVTSDDGRTILHDNSRNKFLIYRLDRMVKRTIWALQKQLMKGRFEPADYELRFDTSERHGRGHGTLDFKLSEDEVMKLTGAIDRLDTYEDDEQIYVKIIDYKSGAKKFDAAALYYGLQLQLVVYMEAAMNMKSEASGGKHVIPAGILYYNIDDPMISGASVSEISGTGAEDKQKVLDDEILTELCTNGVVNADPSIIRLMDQSIAGQSQVIPVALNKDGSLSKKSSAVSTETFNALFKFMSGKLGNMGREILDGHIEAKPYKMNEKINGCTYCPYRPVCSFEESLDGFEYRKLRKLSKDKAWAAICREGEDYGRDVDGSTEESH